MKLSSINIYNFCLLFYLIVALFLGSSSGFKFAISLFLIAVHVLFEKEVNHFRRYAMLLLPICFGAIYSVNTNNIYDISKDIFYLLGAIVYLLLGVVLFDKLSFKYILKLIILFAVGLTLKKILVNFSTGGLSGLINPFSVRYESGFRGNLTPALAAGILLLSTVFDVKIYSKRSTRLLFLLNMFGIYLMASRVFLVIFLSFCLFGLIYKYNRYLKPIIFLSICLSIAFTGVLSDLKIEGGNDKSFLSKITNTISELTVSNYRTEEDINTRYRGYETYMAWRTYTGGSAGTILFGELGQMIDLEVYVAGLNEDGMRYIPILHNGYMYILVKTGILGMLIYLFFYFRLIAYGWRWFRNTDDKVVMFLSAILLSCLVSLIVSNYVIPTFFSGEMILIQLLIGFILTSLINYFSKSDFQKEQSLS